jgi:DNA-binding IclR family transcriptional regulator
MRVLQSVARALDALDFLSANQGAVRLTEVAAYLEVDKSNASHILRTLVASGYAEQVEGRLYRATKKVRRLSTLELDEIIECREQMHETLRQLGNDTGECVHMAVLVGARVWYVDKIESTLPLKVDHPIGSLAPLHCTALGKAFIAFGDAPIPDALAPYTAKTITTRSLLDADIAATKVRGFSTDDEEFSQGIRCIAVPIFDMEKRMVAAVGISGPTARIDDQRLLQLGQTTVKQIEQVWVCCGSYLANTKRENQSRVSLEEIE